MTDEDLAKAAAIHLTRTTVSYPEWKKRVDTGRYTPRDGSATEWGKAFAALAQIQVSDPPPPPASGQFGALLPPRLPESTGPIVTVRTDSELRAAAGTSTPPGTRVRIEGVIRGSGDLYFRCNGTAQAPITFEGPGTITGYGRVYTSGSYIRHRGYEVTGCRDLTITAPSVRAEYDRIYSHHNQKQGIIVSSNVSGWQIWNSRFQHNGEEDNYDHGGYISTASPGCVIANCVFDDNWAYNLQVYPDCKDLIVTCCTIDGGQRQEHERGGIVLGDPGRSQRNRFIGIVSTRAPYNGVLRPYTADGDGNEMFDSVGWGNSDTNFPARGGIRYENCVTVQESPYVNVESGDYRPRPGGPLVGRIQPARYGWVPPFDINGKPRVTADAGAYAI